MEEFDPKHLQPDECLYLNRQDTLIKHNYINIYPYDRLHPQAIDKIITKNNKKTDNNQFCTTGQSAR